MADYYTQFSCILDVGSAENAARADTILRELQGEADDEDSSLGFSMEPDPDTGPGALWIHDDESGEPEHVIKFVLRCAEALDLTGLWGFAWALSCSKPRLDAFGGGAQMIDLGKRCSTGWIDCNTWVEEQTALAVHDADTAQATIVNVRSEPPSAPGLSAGQGDAS